MSTIMNNLTSKELHSMYLEKLKQEYNPGLTLYTIPEYILLKNISRERLYQLIKSTKLTKHRFSNRTFVQENLSWKPKPKGRKKAQNFLKGITDTFLK